MREIKFRVLSYDNEWIYGGKPFSQCYLGKIRDDTLGQFTGLQDKNGVEIYEGDYLDNGVVPIEFKGLEVFYGDGDGAFQMAYSDGQDTFGGEMLLCDCDLNNYEVIGNIHEEE